MVEKSPEKKEAEELRDRIGKALYLAGQFGRIDCEHHKQWVIDQMVRILTGCPTVRREDIDVQGKKYAYEDLGESEEYKEFVRNACKGENDLVTYDWDIGMAP